MTRMICPKTKIEGGSKRVKAKLAGLTGGLFFTSFQQPSVRVEQVEKYDTGAASQRFVERAAHRMKDYIVVEGLFMTDP